jgi:hypothetical protein
MNVLRGFQSMARSTKKSTAKFTSVMTKVTENESITRYRFYLKSRMRLTTSP